MREHQYETKLCSRTVTEGGGSAPMAPRSGFGRRRNTGLKLMHEANVAIYFLHDGRIHIAKNRWGETGDISSEHFLHLMLQMLASKVYNSNAIVFQEGLVNQLEPMIKDFLEKNKVGVKNDDTL